MVRGVNKKAPKYVEARENHYGMILIVICYY